MNDSKVRWPHGGFEDRLEAELVTVVAQRAAIPQRRPAMRRPAVWGGLAASAAGVTAVALGVPALTHPAPTPSARPGPVHIRTAAFTVDSQADGTVHVTWDKSKYSEDRSGLQHALRAAGFPVLIRRAPGAGRRPAHLHHPACSARSQEAGPGISRVRAP